MARIPASVRNLNPGAQWPGEIASRWGSTGFEVLNDGQGNKIASFPTWEQGAAAHIDLLRSKYAGMPLSQAISKWSGGNNVSGYVSRIVRETGISPDTVISDELLRSPQGLALVKSMAGHEKGPNGEGIPDDAWAKAYAMVYDGDAPPAPTQSKPSGGMLDVASASPPSPSGGLLSGLSGSGGFSSMLERFGDPMSSSPASAVGGTERSADPLSGDDGQSLPSMSTALHRQKIDPRQLLAVLQSRSRLGTA